MSNVYWCKRFDKIQGCCPLHLLAIPWFHRVPFHVNCFLSIIMSTFLPSNLHVGDNVNGRVRWHLLHDHPWQSLPGKRTNKQIFAHFLMLSPLSLSFIRWCSSLSLSWYFFHFQGAVFTFSFSFSLSLSKCYFYFHFPGSLFNFHFPGSLFTFTFQVLFLTVGLALFASAIPEIIELLGQRSKYGGAFKNERGWELHSVFVSNTYKNIWSGVTLSSAATSPTSQSPTFSRTSSIQIERRCRKISLHLLKYKLV